MIHRVIHNKENPYFIMNRGPLGDPRLSWKAVGILCYLLSKPDNWVVNAADLVNQHTDGQDSVKSGLKELREAGYIKKRPVRDDSGKILHWEAHIFESPQNDDPDCTNNAENDCNSPEGGKATFWQTNNLENPVHNKYPIPMSSELNVYSGSSPESVTGSNPPVSDHKKSAIPTGQSKRITLADQVNGTTTVKATPEGSFSEKAADKLMNALVRTNTLPASTKPSHWPREIAKFLEKTGTVMVEFSAVLDWYVDHIGDDFVPVALSAHGFCEKFTQIRLARNRALRADGIDPVETVVAETPMKVRQRAAGEFEQWRMGQE